MVRAAIDRRLLGLLALAVIAGIEWGVTRTAAFQRGAAVPMAMLVDLVIVLPAAFAALVLRPARRPLLDAAPVLALGAMLAGVLLSARVETGGALRGAGAVAELVVLALLVRRLRVAASEVRARPGDDLLERVAALGDPLLRVAGAEAAVLYYALRGPRVRRPLRPGEFSYVESSGLGGLLLALGMVVAVEGLGVHLVLRAVSPRAAWVHAALDAYALLWLVALYQAARLRPVSLDPERLVVRTSLLWTVEVPRRAIASVTAMDGGTGRARGVLRAALGAPPVLLLTLSEPVAARGPLGLRRSVDRIALHVDEPAKLEAALALPPG